MRRSRKLTHWTGHKSRLDHGFGVHRLGSNAYAQEELVAELGAAFICADLELTLVPREDHASYIANWFEVLKNDNRAVFTPPRTRSAPRISSTRRARSQLRTHKRPPPRRPRSFRKKFFYLRGRRLARARFAHNQSRKLIAVLRLKARMRMLSQ